MKFLHIVACNDDDTEGRVPGCIQATRQAWSDEAKAIAYAKTIAPGRKPMVITISHPDSWRIDLTEPG